MRLFTILLITRHVKSLTCIFMQDTGKLFSDPVALSKVKENKEQEIDPKWRVLVVGKYTDYPVSVAVLEPGMWVAYEVSG